MGDYLYQYFSMNCTDGDSIEVPFPSCASFDTGGEFTIEAWVKVPAYQANMVVLEQKNNGFSLTLFNNKVVLSYPGQKEMTTDITGLCDTIWLNITVIAFKKDVRIFINGELGIEAIVEAGYENTSSLLIGRNFVGNIRWLRIYKYAFMSSDIPSFIYSFDKTDQMAAFYDFTQNPPLEQISGTIISLSKKQNIITSFPSAKCGKKTWFISPEGSSVNPGGRGKYPYTIQMWICPEVTGEDMYETLVSNTGIQQDGGIEIALQKNEKSYKLAIIYNNSISKDIMLLSDKNIEPNVWVNIAVVYSPVSLILYIDGIKDKEVNNIASPSELISGNRVVIGAHIERQISSGHDFYYGYISRIDIWDSALEKSALIQYMNEKPMIDSMNLQATWDFFDDNLTNPISGISLLNTGKAEIEEYSSTVDSVRSEYHNVIVNVTDEMDPLTKEELENCRKESGILAADGIETQFRTTLFQKNGEIHIVMHTAKQSFTITTLEANAEEWDELTIWEIQLFIIILNSITMFLFAKNIPYNRHTGLLVYDFFVHHTGMRMVIANLNEINIVSSLASIITIMIGEANLKDLLYLLLKVTFWDVAVGIAILGARLTLGGGGVWAALAVLGTSVLIHLGKLPRILCKLQLYEIYFIHNKQGAIGGINIRKNKEEKWFIPEWSSERKLQLPNTTAPVVYRISRFNNDPLQIKVYFQRTNAANFNSVKIRGKAVGNNSTYLGDTTEETITFPTGRFQSNAVFFTLSHRVIQSSGIQKKHISWDWQYYDEEKNEWISIVQTLHTIYAILDDVHEPWGRTNIDSLPRISTPWTDIYDMFIDKLEGISDLKQVPSILTSYIYNNMSLKYVGGTSFAGINKIGSIKYDLVCPSFLIYTLGMNGTEITNDNVNCLECATLLTIVSNIFGCHLRVIIIEPINNKKDFKVHNVKLIGFREYTPPGGEASSEEGFFNFHAVATDTSSIKYLSKINIYYPCIMYRSVIDNHECLAAGVKFSKYNGMPPLPIHDILEDTYRESVLQNNEEGIGSAYISNVVDVCFNSDC